MKDALLTFKSVDLQPRIFNEYQIRISVPDMNVFFDWYHTTGSVVMTTKNYNKSLGKAFTSDDAEKIICKQLEENNL